MMLPGGILHQGDLRRDFAFRPLTGAVEMGVAEATELAYDLPSQVTQALQAALAHVGGLRPDSELVEGLSVADRQFLMVRLAEALGLGQPWRSALCRQCDAPFDFRIDLAQLPIKAAADGYPTAHLRLEAGLVTLRVPTGADQRALLTVDDVDQARRLLAQRCVLSWEGGDPSRLDLDEATIAAIEAALETIAPELASAAQAPCPECGAANLLAIDPYVILGRTGDDIFDDIHRLASHYHWSEADILALPRWRWRRYLALIERDQGIVH